jgi:hypothetical protein
MNLHEENITLKEQTKTDHEKLVKAKAVSPPPLSRRLALNRFAQFIKSQDEIIQEQVAKLAGASSVCRLAPEIFAFVCTNWPSIGQL